MKEPGRAKARRPRRAGTGPPPVAKKKAAPASTEKAFPVVGVGASAGGLEAFTHLLQALPTDTGMAFVLVQHLDPKHESMLPTILAKATRLPIRQVEDGLPVEPNRVYVIPPNRNMVIQRGVLRLMPRIEGRGPHMPIDFFLRSLAQDQQSRAIGVILSGTASDGALGIGAIKAEGGITFAQDEQSAKYDGMPRAAIAAGCVDFILPPEAIAREMARIARHPYVVDTEAAPVVEHLHEASDEIGKILLLLRSATGVDFAHYKPTTIKRRISRRMILHKIDSLAGYLDHLQGHPAEVPALYNDILITVTGFFRDPEIFDFLKSKVLLPLLKNRPATAPVRVWVPGCATGEEAYSLAICMLECLGEMTANAPAQIFATDISEPAIEKARAGIYPENISLDVTPERLRRFFVRVDGGYQISKSVRDMCIFARQNLAKDPPFSRLDLISCRNLMIYLGSALQKRVMSVFHYALKPGRHLLLGASETISAFSDLFSLTDRSHKLYTKRAHATPAQFDLLTGEVAEKQATAAGKVPEESERRFDVHREADRVLLERYAPCGVVINENMEIEQFRGRTSPYLEPAPGAASFNLMKMAREGLLFDLRALIHKAQRDNRPARKDRVRYQHDDHFREITLEVAPLRTPVGHPRSYLVLFQPAAGPAPAARAASASRRGARGNEHEREIARLNRELTATKEHLQSIIEEQEATNEELKSASEEVLSSNEELQSTNEELETAKEELQSTNEEITTVNEELQTRNLELSLAMNDLNNLLASVKIPVVMLGSDLRIRRFTPMAEKTLNLIPADVGRPITDIKFNIQVPELEKLVLEVLDTMTAREVEAQDAEGRWYRLLARPYRTGDNKIDGVVLAYMDIDSHKRARLKLEQSAEEMQHQLRFLAAVSDYIVLIDLHGNVEFINRLPPDLSPEQVIGRSIYERGDPAEREVLRKSIRKVTETGETADCVLHGSGPRAQTQFAVRVGPMRQEGAIVGVYLMGREIFARPAGRGQ